MGHPLLCRQVNVIPATKYILMVERLCAGMLVCPRSVLPCKLREKQMALVDSNFAVADAKSTYPTFACRDLESTLSR